MTSDTNSPGADTLEACRERCLAMDAPLAVRLAAYASDVRRLEPAYAEIVDRLVAQLRLGEAGLSAPASGMPMPPFVLPDESGGLVSLSGLAAVGPVVVAFLRGHWCPYCQMTAGALRGMEAGVAAAGGRMVAITPEVQRFTRLLKARTRVSFPILTDLDNGYALRAGLAFRVSEELRQSMIEDGRLLPDLHGNDGWTLPIPATFVVGRDGRVKARYVDPDFRKRMALEDALAALRQAAAEPPLPRPLS